MGEFSGYPISIATSPEEVQEAFGGPERVRLVVAAALLEQGKFTGLYPVLIDELDIDSDTVVLVEGDGSRHKPLKVPTSREPVIPSCSRTVLALMGASGFGERIDEEHCYNHQAALDILPKGTPRFDAAALAAMAGHPACGRKGVEPGMRFHILMNQGDLAEKRSIGSHALEILATEKGIEGSLVSLQREAVYEISRL
jgi:probable selenium-dependent hydroxylase accessory protein YqeC